MITKWSFLKLLLFYTVQVTGQNKYCYSTEKNPYLNFAPLTSYDHVRGSKIELPKICKPIYLWSLIKPWEPTVNISHYRQTADLSRIKEKILENHAQKHGELCDQDIANLKRWVFNSETDNGKLSARIQSTTKKWVEQLRNTFENMNDDQNLLKIPSSEERPFEIQSANTMLAQTAAIQLVRTLYGKEYFNVDTELYSENDILLQLDEHCPAWKKLLNNPNLLSEKLVPLQKWYKLNNTLQEVSDRLGYQKNDSLSIADLVIMFCSCAFETLLKTETRPACAAFLPEHLKVIEYMDDFMYYYLNGYGNEHSAKMGCPIIQTMLNNLTSAAQNSNTKIKASFFTTYSTILTSAIVKLGLFDDKYFPHPNDRNVFSERKWNSSFLYPSSANLIVILYKCHEDDLDNRVAFFYNEKPISVPGCRENLCSLNFLKRKYADVFLPDQCGSKFCSPTK